MPWRNTVLPGSVVTQYMERMGNDIKLAMKWSKIFKDLTSPACTSPVNKL